jgi:hypothetical protein
MNYIKIYNQIVEKAKSENRVKGGDTYYEAHHITPKCLGGEGKYSDWRTHPNIILLTAREHFLCHRLLHEIYPDNEHLSRALWFMCTINNKNHQRDYKVSCRLYEYSKLQMSISLKNRISPMKGKIPWNKGKKLIDPKYSKGGKTNYGRKHSDLINKKKGSIGNKHGSKSISYNSLFLQFTSIEEASKYLQVPRHFIYKLIKDKEIIYDK